MVETSAQGVPTLAVTERCQLEIGRMESDPAHVFARIGATYLLRDGRVVVVDAVAREIRYFSGAGRHQSTSGGEGEGPGEFREITSVALVAGDSLDIYDRRSNRITVLGPRGELIRTRSTSGLRGLYRTRLLGRIDDRVAVAWRTPVWATSGPQEYYRDTVRIGLIDAGFDSIHVVRELPGGEWYYPDVRRGLAVGDERVSVVSGPGYRITFGYDVDVAVWRSTLVYGDRASYELTVLDPSSGEVRRIRRSDRPFLPLDHPLVELYVQGREERYGGGQLFDAVVGQLEALPPDHGVPAYAGFMGGDAQLWVRDFPDPRLDARSLRERWSVYDSSGTMTASVVAPPGFEVIDHGMDRVVGLRRTDLDVPYVQVCGIEGER